MIIRLQTFTNEYKQIQTFIIQLGQLLTHHFGEIIHHLNKKHYEKFI